MRIRFLLGLAFFATAASAQVTNPTASPRPLSLRECIDLALSQNLSLRIERLTTDIAGDALRGAYGAYDPVFTAGATDNYLSDPGDFDARKFNPYFPAEITTEKFSSDISGKVPFGLSYDFGGSVRKNDAVTDFRLDPGDARLFPGGIRSTNDFNADVGLKLRQHLLKDFWMDEDREKLLARRLDLKISEQALRFEIMKTLLAVELGYYDLAAAREEIRVREKAVELRRQFVAETKRRVDLGDLPPLELAQAQTQQQNALTALSAARETFSSRQNGLIGLLTDDFKKWAAVEVQPTDALMALPIDVDRARSFQNALTNRPDLIEARLAVRKSDVMVKFRLNQLFPSLDLVGGYGGLGSYSDPSAALNGAFSFNHPEYSYGAVVAFPLGNIRERSDYRAGKASKKIAELQLQKAEQDVLMQVADFANRVEFRFSQVVSTHQARIYAEEALEAETKKLQNGFTTSFVVLQFQEILTTAQTAEIRAKVDYNDILAQLAFAEGTIIERHHLSLEVR